MGVLSDQDLRRLRARGELRIEPFLEKNLTPNGYDVTIGEVVIPSKKVRIDEGAASVPPHTRFAVGTREVVELGRSLVGQIWLRTTWARRGVLASFGLIDAGFSGTLTFGAQNASEDFLELPIGDRFAQIVFFALDSPATGSYEERSGHYQGQRRVILDGP